MDERQALIDAKSVTLSGRQATQAFAMPADANKVELELDRAALDAHPVDSVRIRFEISYDGGVTWPQDYDYSGKTKYPAITPIAEFCEGTLGLGAAYKAWADPSVWERVKGVFGAKGQDGELRLVNRPSLLLHRPGKFAGFRMLRVIITAPVDIVTDLKLSTVKVDLPAQEASNVSRV